VWLAAAVLCLLIIASRKHYSVDVLVAWWTVPLVFYTYHRRWTTTRPVMEEEEERFGPAMYLPQYGNAHLEHSPPHGGNASIMEMAPLAGGGDLPPRHADSSMSTPALSTTEENGPMPQRRGSHLNLNAYYREEDSMGDAAPSPAHKSDDLCTIS